MKTYKYLLTFKAEYYIPIPYVKDQFKNRNHLNIEHNTVRMIKPIETAGEKVVVTGMWKQELTKYSYICPNCRGDSKLIEEFKFCPYCGIKLVWRL